MSRSQEQPQLACLWGSPPPHAVSCCCAVATPPAVWTGGAEGTVIRWVLLEAGAVPYSCLLGHSAPVVALVCTQSGGGDRVVSACGTGSLRAWCPRTGVCQAATRVPTAAGPVLTLAAGEGTGPAPVVVAACASAVLLLHGQTLELTRALGGSSLPRSPLLALVCVLSPTPPDEHAPRRLGGSSNALAALTTVRAEEAEVALTGVDGSGVTWLWQGPAAGETRLPGPKLGSGAGPPSQLALLGWATPGATPSSVAPITPPRARSALLAAALPPGGAEAALVSSAGWAVASSARPPPGAPPAAARISGEGLFAGAAFLSPGRLLLWSATGSAQLLELAASPSSRAGSRLVLCVAPAEGPSPSAWCLAASPSAEQLLVRVSGNPPTLSAWHVLQSAFSLASAPASPLFISPLDSGWLGMPDSDEGAVTACAFAGGGALAPTWMLQGFERGAVALRALPPAATLTAWLRGHTAAVRALAAARTGAASLLLSAGDDMTVRCWASPGGEPLAVLRHHISPVVSLRVMRQSAGSGDGIALSEGEDGTLALLSLPAAGAPACERLLPPLPGAGTGVVLSAALAGPSGGALLVARTGGACVWDVLSGAPDRCLTAAAGEELMEAAHRADHVTASVQALRGRMVAPWSLTLSCDAGALLDATSRSRAGGPDGHGNGWWWGAAPVGALANEEEHALRLALAALYCWGDDASLDAQLRAVGIRANAGSGFSPAPALAGEGAALTLSTPAATAAHSLLRVSPRFVAQRALAIAALARRLTRLGEAGRGAAAALLAFATAQLPLPPAAPPALAVYAAAWLDPNEAVREAARALVAAAPAAAMPAPLRTEGAPASWRVIEEAAGGPPADSPACTGRLGVLVAGCAAVAALRRDELGLLPPALLPRLVQALRGLVRESPAPHGAAATSLLAEGMACWWASRLGEAERGALAEEALELCERLAAGGVGGGATDVMVAREAGAELLAALAEAAPALFLAVLQGRFANAAPDSAAHVAAFLALIRVVQQQPAVVAPHLERLMEAVCAAGAPAAGGSRRTCATVAVGLVAELALHLPGAVAYARAPGRVAVAVHAPGGRLGFRVYDLGPHGGVVRHLEASPDEPALPGRAGDVGAVLRFDTDASRLAAYHPAVAALRFWTLGGAASGWRQAGRGLQPARACRVAETEAPTGAASPSSRAAAYRLEWIYGIGAGLALLHASDGSRAAFLPVI